MNTSEDRAAISSPPDLCELNGRIVLVKSNRDHRNPPTAMRGWLEVPAQASSGAEVSVGVEFPQMFSSRAHHRSFRLDESSFAQLLASERNGIFEFTIEEELK